jgi:hypothetical protein
VPDRNLCIGGRGSRPISRPSNHDNRYCRKAACPRPLRPPGPVPPRADVAQHLDVPAREHQVAPKPRPVVRDVSEAVLRILFRHRRKLDPFSEALFGDDGHDQVGEDRSSPAATTDRIDLHEFVGRIGCLYGTFPKLISHLVGTGGQLL